MNSTNDKKTSSKGACYTAAEINLRIIFCKGKKDKSLLFALFSLPGFCPTVTHILNGKVVSVKPNVGQVAVAFLCNKNHRLIGKSRLECISGRWNGALPFCESMLLCR